MGRLCEVAGEKSSTTMHLRLGMSQKISLSGPRQLQFSSFENNNVFIFKNVKTRYIESLAITA